MVSTPNRRYPRVAGQHGDGAENLPQQQLHRGYPAGNAWQPLQPKGERTKDLGVCCCARVKKGGRHSLVDDSVRSLWGDGAASTPFSKDTAYGRYNKRCFSFISARMQANRFYCALCFAHRARQAIFFFFVRSTIAPPRLQFVPLSPSPPPFHRSCLQTQHGTRW